MLWYWLNKQAVYLSNHKHIIWLSFIGFDPQEQKTWHCWIKRDLSREISQLGKVKKHYFINHSGRALESWLSSCGFQRQLKYSHRQLLLYINSSQPICLLLVQTIIETFCVNVLNKLKASCCWCKNEHVGEAAIAQWNHLSLPPCSPGF